MWLLDGAAAALHELATCASVGETKVAVASRTNKARWAELLLQDMEIPGCPGRRVNDLLARSEIYTGDKQRHLSRLHEVWASNMIECSSLTMRKAVSTATASQLRALAC